MIVSAIVDPSVFGPACAGDELAKRELLAFLAGIISNGVILCDPDRQMIRDALAAAQELSKQHGGTERAQRILLLLTEIYQHPKKFLVCCNEQEWKRRNPTHFAEQVRTLNELLNTDVVLAQPTTHGVLSKVAGTSVELIDPLNVTLSRYEATRTRIANPALPLDQLSVGELEELIGRAVRYSTVLRVFDYRMVARRTRIRRYLAGIKFVANIWAQWCRVADHSSRCIELFTVANTQTQDGYLTAAEANSRIESGLIQQLSGSQAFRVIGVIKDDSKGIFHARGFEAKKRAYTLDPGFDALGATGATRRCLLKADVAAAAHFEQCRSLRKA